MSDTVGHVGEFVGGQAIEILKDVVFENFAVKFGNAVDLMAGGDRKVGHLDHSVVYDRGALHKIGVVSLLPNIGPVTVVNFGDDLENSWQARREKLGRPALQRLAHDRVVGIGHRFCHNVPRLVPRIAALVKKNSHKLGNGKHGVGVVGVNGGKIGQLVDGMLFKMIFNNVLNRGRHKKILLAQAEGFSLGMIVGGVEHLAYDLSH